MTDWKEWVSDSQKRWEENASYWDERMGEESIFTGHFRNW